MSALLTQYPFSQCLLEEALSDPHILRIIVDANVMTYFPDLSKYTYTSRTQNRDKNLRNVGWLSASEPFTMGAIPASALKKLIWIFEFKVTQPFGPCGFHLCEFCDIEQLPELESKPRGDLSSITSNGEIRVFSNTGDVYCAPNLIVHYVLEHNYRPPDEFVRALIEGPLPPSQEYVTLLDGLNEGWARYDINEDGRFSFKDLRSESDRWI